LSEKQFQAGTSMKTEYKEKNVGFKMYKKLLCDFLKILTQEAYFFIDT
jgi:hypothetical protein